MRFALAVAGIALLVSCTSGKEPGTPGESSSSTTAPSATPSVQPVTDYSSLTVALEAQGLAVRLGERRRLIGTDVSGQEVFIDGVPIEVYEFPTEKAFDEVRSTIRPRGDIVGDAIINWNAPRFYDAGRLLVLYFGDKQRTRDVLDSLLGPAFAGV
jgi:hypothetical protein